MSAEDGGLVTVKSEPIDPVNLEARILELCAECQNGLADADLQTATPNIDAAQRAAVINSLLTKDKISLLKSATGRLVYKLKNADSLLKIQGADREEKVVYQAVEQAGNKGIWIRDVRTKTNLPQAQLTKILRTLETKKLIKSVKSVGAVRKKVYMLFELEPDASLAGGTFYSDQEFDVEFANLLSLQCCKYLQAKSQLAAERFPREPQRRRAMAFIATSEVLEHIKQLKISNVDLKLNDIEAVLNTLVWDGKCERMVSADDRTYFSYAKPVLPSAGLVRIPCGNCPVSLSNSFNSLICSCVFIIVHNLLSFMVFDDCHPEGTISPANCQYMKAWLDAAD